MSASESQNKAHRLDRRNGGPGGPGAYSNGAPIPARMVNDNSEASAFSINEVLCCLFRHKWKVIILGLLGLVSAGSLYYFTDAAYESRAKLLVRYVVERSPVDTVESNVQTNSSRGGAAVMNTEAEILTSYDIAKEVASLVGVQKILPDSELAPDSSEALEAAAGVVHGNTTVELGNGNILGVAFRHEVPDTTSEVLNSLISVYFKRHLEIHRSSDSAKAAGERLKDIKSKLRGVEDQLSKLKEQAKILSVEGSITALTSQLGLLESEVRAAEADIAGQQASVGAFEQARPGEEDAESDGSAFTQQDIEEYQTFVELLKFLRQRKMRALTQYTPGSSIVQNNERQIEEAEAKQRELERRFPGIASMAPSTASGSGGNTTNILSAKASLAAAKARKEILSSQLTDLQGQIDTMGRTFREIEELEREKRVAIENYQYVAAAIERADVDTYLDPKSMPNISIVQKPAGITKVIDERTKKLMAGLAGGGFALGIALAFFLDFLVNRTVKRPHDINVVVDAAPMLTIPEFSPRNQKKVHRLPDSKAEKGGKTARLLTDNKSSSHADKSRSGSGRSSKSRRRPAETIAQPTGGSKKEDSTSTSTSRSKEKGSSHSRSRSGSPWSEDPRFEDSRSDSGRPSEAQSAPAEIIAQPAGKQDKNGSATDSRSTEKSISPWSGDHFIRPYADAIRDRLSCYFEINNLTHKPKLVAVTGVTGGVGSSTLAVSLAASFSETGDGNVLLVDMNVGKAEVQSFYRGKPSSSLIDALANNDRHISFEEPVGENLYLATTTSQEVGSRKFFAKKLYELIPEFKKSDFDYIIFDMPAVSPISPTESMAPFMDKVLLVAEEGKTDKADLKRGNDALAKSGADVSILLNKSKSTTPKFLEG